MSKIDPKNISNRNYAMFEIYSTKFCVIILEIIKDHYICALANDPSTILVRLMHYT